MVAVLKKELPEGVSTVDLFSPKATERIYNTHTQELVIALCGPIGSPLHEVSKEISDTLTN